jgi:hypothetical protein
MVRDLISFLMGEIPGNFHLRIFQSPTNHWKYRGGKREQGEIYDSQTVAR